MSWQQARPNYWGERAAVALAAVANTYNYARLLRSTKLEDKDAMSKIGFVWPNQKTVGAHVNITGGGITRNAPHREAAVKFMECLVGNDAQRYFADGNNEWPVVATASTQNPALESLGKFKGETLSIATIGRNLIVAKKILERVGNK